MTQQENWSTYFAANPQEGTLKWLTRPREHFVNQQTWKSWNTRHAGNAGKLRSRISPRPMSLPKMSRKRMAAMNDGTFKPWEKKRREPTGEIALLDRLIVERGPFSEISGVALPPKGTPRYHHAISHLLSKGEYPELRLEDFNIVLMTAAEHEAWHTRKWTLRERPEWRWVFEKEAAIKLEIRTR